MTKKGRSNIWVEVKFCQNGRSKVWVEVKLSDFIVISWKLASDLKERPDKPRWHSEKLVAMTKKQFDLQAFVCKIFDNKSYLFSSTSDGIQIICTNIFQGQKHKKYLNCTKVAFRYWSQINAKSADVFHNSELFIFLIQTNTVCLLWYNI